MVSSLEVVLTRAAHCKAAWRLNPIVRADAARPHERSGRPPGHYVPAVLRVACWYEQTEKARLLTLVMALETLLDHPPRHVVVHQLLTTWRDEAASIKSKYKPGTDEYVALESLERELLFKKHNSLRRQVRALVYETLEPSVGSDQAQESASTAVKVYDARSILLHNGYLPDDKLRRSTSQAKAILEQVLRIKLETM